MLIFRMISTKTVHQESQPDRGQDNPGRYNIFFYFWKIKNAYKCVQLCCTKIMINPNPHCLGI
jgi:hypothetical protein